MTDSTAIWREMGRLSITLDEALSELRKRAVKAAELDTEYKKRMAECYLLAAGDTVKEREAHATIETAKLALDARIAAALERSAIEAVRSKRQQLSALQTIASAHKAEAEFTRTAPPGANIGGLG
jgi:hypothetical protein